MKLFRIFPALLIALAFFATACGPSEEETQFKSLTASQKDANAAMLRDIKASQQQTANMLADASTARGQLQQANDKVHDLESSLRAMQEKFSAQEQAINKSNDDIAASEKKAGQRSGKLLYVIVVLLILIVVAFVIFRMMSGSRSEFDDEDDDFSDFEDDEDLGFEEGDFEDDFGDGKKKPGIPGDDDKA
ncbi:hypothetical protein BH09SUM1_BH09SUM1_31760 [soil metagenome]